MTRADVTARDILDTLMDKYCSECRDIDDCSGCLAIEAYRRADWLEEQRYQTVKERGEG